MPKSRTFTVSGIAASASRKMLSGLMSRWTTPARCAAPSAESTCAVMNATRSAGIGPSCSMRPASDSPRKQLHHEKRLLSQLFRVLKIRHLNDVGMAERRDDLGLATKALELLAIERKPFVEQLHGDSASEILLYGLVHRPHSTASERGAEAVTSTE